MRFFASAVLACLSFQHVANAVIVREESSGFKAVQAKEAVCDFAVDVAQLVDVSWSQLDNSAELKGDAGVVLKFAESSGGRHRVALATFIDKPIPPLGWKTAEWTDYCFRLRLPFGTSDEMYQDEINRIYLAGGYDFPEAQLEALLRGALTDQLVWRSTTEDGELPVQKVLLVATDSIAHAAGDALAAVQKLEEKGNKEYPEPTPNYLTEKDLVDGGLNIDCGTIDYPSLSLLAQVLKAKNYVPVFLVAPASFECDTNPSGRCVFPEMMKLAKATGNPDYADAEKGIVLFYTELLKSMRVPGVVVPMGLGFAGYGDALVQAIQEVGSIKCDETTTTTTTTPPTTPEVTTPPTTPPPTESTGVTAGSLETLATLTTGPSTVVTDTQVTDDCHPGCCGVGCQLVVEVKIENDCNGGVVEKSYDV